MTKSRNILAKRRFWSARELDLLRRLYADHPTAELANMLQRSLRGTYQAARILGLHKSDKYLASPAARRVRCGEHRGLATQFKPGQVPANKGLRRPGWAPGRMAETQFKPGERSGMAEKNWCPVGTIRGDREGYLRIKIREGQKGEAYGFGNTKIWPLLNRRVWEQHHGPVPSGHIVVFKDKDRSNVAIENLDLISRTELMARNSVHRLPKELADIIQLSGALKGKLRRINEKQNDGFAQPPIRDTRSAQR
jgi:hypothetical protein